MSFVDLLFKGINIHPNITNGQLGDCEEMINVCNENGNLKIKQDAKEISDTIPYKNIIIHQVGQNEQYIGIDSEGVVWFNTSGEIIKRMYYSGYSDGIYLSTVSNMLVISDKKVIKTVVYVYSDGTYKEFYNDSVFQFPISHTIYQNTLSDASYISGDVGSDNITDKSIYVQTLKAIINKAESEYENAAEGVFLLAFTVSLYDNSEIGPFEMKTISVERSDDVFLSDGFVTTTTSGRIVVNLAKAYRNIAVRVYPNTGLMEYSELVRSINLYVSQPISRFQIDEAGVHISSTPTDSGTFPTRIDEKYVSNMGIPRSLLYLVKSWNLDEFSKGFIYDIEFKGDTITTGATMPVLSGHIRRAGKMINYNNRIHYYSSRVKLLPTLPTLFTKKTTDLDNLNVTVYVFYKVENSKNITIPYNDVVIAQLESDSNKPSISLPEMIIIQDTRAYRMLIVYEDQNSVFQKNITLSPSSTYDYAYAYGRMYEGQMDQFSYSELPETTDNEYDEFDIINVSTLNNPIVFPVRNSYRFRGEILYIGYVLEPISQVQIGKDPLYIFTTQGIYVLSQGTGDVLYGDITMINSDVAQGIAQTRTNVVYITNKSVYILDGRRAINISLPIEGRFDTSIRLSEAFTQCCLNDSLHNIYGFLSSCEFKEYIINVSLSYIPADDAIIISNPMFSYSYIFSFMYSSWSKISGCYTSVRGNMLCKRVSKSESAATRAEGSITVANVIISPEHTFNCTAYGQYNGIYYSGYNEMYALLVNDIQVSASIFRFRTPISIIMSSLTRDIEYMEDYYDDGVLTVYYSLPIEEGCNIKLINLTKNETVFTITLEHFSGTPIIPAKGIGDKVVVNGYSTRKLISTDSVLTVVSIVTNLINKTYSIPLSAYANGNIIDVVSEIIGSSGNDIAINIQCGNYVNVNIEPMTGGKDVTVEPGDHSVIVDFSTKVITNKVIHLQTRPISFNNDYTLISRAILYCRAILAQSNNLSLYIFASNNLSSWVCVAAVQRTGISLEHLRTQRVAKSYKYYIFIIGGMVYTDSELIKMTIDVSVKHTKKKR